MKRGERGNTIEVWRLSKREREGHRVKYFREEER